MNLTMELNTKSISYGSLPKGCLIVFDANVYAPFQGRAKAMAREERRMEENTNTVIQIA